MRFQPLDHFKTVVSKDGSGVWPGVPKLLSLDLNGSAPPLKRRNTLVLRRGIWALIQSNAKRSGVKRELVSLGDLTQRMRSRHGETDRKCPHNDAPGRATSD